MAFLSISEAAGIAGVTKVTIWRFIKQGKLSAERQDNKAYRIEESELMRVFPEITEKRETVSELRGESLQETLQVESLKAQIALLKDQLNAMQHREEWLMRRIETLEVTQQRLLPPPKKPFLDRLAEAWGRFRR